MIRFESELNRKFEIFLSYVLTDFVRTWIHDHGEDGDALGILDLEFLGWDALKHGAEDLLGSHQKTAKYSITEYQWLILARILEFYSEEGEGAEIIERYFWDTDYEFTPEMVTAGSNTMGFGNELFGVVNKLMPTIAEVTATKYDDEEEEDEEECEEDE